MNIRYHIGVYSSCCGSDSGCDFGFAGSVDDSGNYSGRGSDGNIGSSSYSGRGFSSDGSGNDIGIGYGDEFRLSIDSGSGSGAGGDDDSGNDIGSDS